MRSLFGFLLLTIVAAASIAAQSGRKKTVSPTPTPVVAKDDPAAYSESKPSPRSSRAYSPPPTPPEPKILPPVKTATSTNDDGETLKVETNLITIPVSVYDRNGLYIPGLRQENFKIFEDGKEQEIAYFGTSDKPVTVALLIDTSPSTQYRIDEIHAAAVAFVEKLSAQDKVIVIEFHNSVKVQCEATTDRQKIIKGIYKAKFGGGTSLYNAVDTGLRKQLSKFTGRKAVVLFTDGVDTESESNTYESTVAYAEEADALVFPIYYNTFMDNFGSGGGVMSGGVLGGIFDPGPPVRGTTAGEYAEGKKYLEELAAATGGRVFRPEATPGGLTAAFEGIAEELRRQYNIGYVPSDEGRVGQRKNIKVRVDRPNLVIRSRDSYIVGSAMSSGQVVPTKK